MLLVMALFILALMELATVILALMAWKAADVDWNGFRVDMKSNKLLSLSQKVNNRDSRDIWGKFSITCLTFPCFILYSYFFFVKSKSLWTPQSNPFSNFFSLYVYNYIVRPWVFWKKYYLCAWGVGTRASAARSGSRSRREKHKFKRINNSLR